ncbi:hypothetical protein E4T44_04352 [Aureobasidium sp. EXF-8845]|nr:hypothetical protein E4T44_04352 [Aureobasidium sp. EXF-8845]KAI4853531.1 hypothetical protein E4T45_04292 [Aureobasidium sp. EXF-8846]
MKRNLLLCVDAFGTLFRPRSPIAEQYGQVARGMGVKISDEEIAREFKSGEFSPFSFKEISKAYPNYGKKTDMGARQWWTEVITKTFTPHHSGPLPSNLTSTLINRFWCKDGYTLFSDVSYLQSLSTTPQRQRAAKQRLVIGVITNSDDRVPDVLSSLGLRVNGLRYNSDTKVTVEESEQQEGEGAEDIDFCIMSYDVGVEKPGREIFDAAISTLGSMLDSEGKTYEDKDWGKVYVGDEVGKDAKGAVLAGWDALLLDRGAEVDAAYEGDAPGVEGFIDVEGKKVPILKGFEALGTYGGHELLKIH